MGGHEPDPQVQKYLDEMAQEHFKEATYWDKISLPKTNTLSHARQKRMARAERNGGRMIPIIKQRRK